MAELPKYRPLGVSIASIPTVDFTATGAAQARVYSTVSRGLDAMSQHLFRKEEAQAKAAGADIGAAQSEQTLARLRDKNFGEMTVYDQAAYLAATDAAATKIETEARRTMGEIVMRAEIEGITPQDLQMELDDAVVGFSDSISSLSPASSNRLYATLSRLKDSEFLNYSKVFIKESIAKDQAQGLEGLDMISRGIETMARSNPLDFDNALDDEIANLEVYLAHQQFGPEDIARESLATRTRAHKARLRGMFDDVEGIAAQAAFIENLQNDLETGGELTSGLDDKEASSLISEFAAVYKAGKKEQGTAVSSLLSDVKTDVSGPVKKGAVPPRGTMQKLRNEAQILQKNGADVSEIFEILDNAEADAGFIRGLADMSETELKEHRNALIEQQYEGITPSGLLRLGAVKQRLSEIETQNADIKKLLAPISTAVKKEMADLEKVIDDGRPLRDDAFNSIDVGISLLQKSNIEDADVLAAELQELRNRALFYERIRKATPDDLQAIKAGLQSRSDAEGTSPELNRRINIINARITEQANALGKDPVGWGKVTGSITTDNMMGQIVSTDFDGRVSIYKKRANEALAFSAKMNRAPIFLDANEAAGLTNILRQSSVEQKLALISELQQGFGIHSPLVFAQISDNVPEIAHVAGLINIGANIQTAKDALRGLELINTGVVLKVSGQRTDQTERARASIGNMSNSPKTKKGILSTADAIYAARSGGEETFNRDMYDTALQEAAGRLTSPDGTEFGGIVQYNGNGIVLPRNIVQNAGSGDDYLELEDVINGITETNLRAASGGYLPHGMAGPISVEALIDNINLVQGDDGRVVVRFDMSGDIYDLTNEIGDQYSIDLEVLAQSVIDARAR